VRCCRGWQPGAEHLREQAAAGPPLETIGDEWIAGVKAGRIGRRKGRGKAYTTTTIRDYERSYWKFIRPDSDRCLLMRSASSSGRCGSIVLSRERLSRSRIPTHVAVASALYAWAMAPSRRLATRNPLRLVELPPNDETPRLRVAFAPEAERLLSALEPEDQVPTRSRSFRSGCTRRSKWLRLMPSEAAASPRVRAVRGTAASGRVEFERT